MTEVILKAIEQLGNFLEEFEGFLIGLSSGTNILFVGLGIVTIIATILYFTRSQVKMTFLAK